MAGSAAAFVDKRQAPAVSHIESAWSVVARPDGRLYWLTNHDRIVAAAVVLVRGVDSSTHVWIDVPMREWSQVRLASADCACPAKIVVRFDDAIVWVEAKQAGPIAYLCGDDRQARVRLMTNRMAPVRVGTIW